MDCDVLIVGGRIIDGSGNPWRFGDVAIKDDRIVAIAPPGRIGREGAATVVDARGKVVAPGFIDIQSHSLHPLYRDGRVVSKITQGVTTEILGELWTPGPFGGRRKDPFPAFQGSEALDAESRTWARFSDWLRSYEQRGAAVNVGSFVGGATVREWACAWDADPATPAQTEEMRRVTAEAMEDGAFGIAPALIYPPSSFSTDEELTAVAEVVGRYGGVYIVHLRSEGEGFLEALEATLALSRDADCPVEVYHFKASGEANWPKYARAIERIDRARGEGIDVTADMYPYPASGTGLSVLIPDWASEGGRLWENLRDPEARKRIHAEMLDPSSSSGDFSGNESGARESRRSDHVMPLGFEKEENRRYAGMRLTEIAVEQGKDWAATAIDLLLSEGQRISTVFFSMSEENVRLGLAQSWVKVSSDAGGIDPAGQTTPVHPRGYGTFPRVLGKYVREEGILSLEEGVRKMTSAVADRIDLKGRGLLREGFIADVVVFDPDTIADRATFTEPHQLSVGVEQVFVNGVRVVQDGAVTGALPGRCVYRGQ
ncbi:MAG TPA: D-aminoacylase [Armatimonadaceae bacterium]|nr:D-aminoacylase [Armatimonadaceae bacterium]